MMRTRCTLQRPEEAGLPRLWNELGRGARHALVSQKGWVGVPRGGDTDRTCHVHSAPWMPGSVVSDSTQ